MSVLPGMGGGFLGKQSNVLLDIELVSSSSAQAITVPAGAVRMDVYGIGMGADGNPGTASYGGEGGTGGSFLAVENIVIDDTTLYALEYQSSYFMLSNQPGGFGTQYYGVVNGNAGGGKGEFPGIFSSGTKLDEFYGGIGGSGVPYQHGGGGGGAGNGGGGNGVFCDGGQGVASTPGFSGAGGAGGVGVFQSGSGGQGATVNLIGFGGNNYGGGGAGSGRNNGVTPLGAPGWMRIRFKNSSAAARLFEPSGVVHPPG